MNLYILDENGNAIPEPDLMKWAESVVGHKYWRVAEDWVNGQSVRVSTIFLGLDHRWGGGDPVLWETMIFGGEHDGYQERYTSQRAALDGHAAAVLLARGSTP